MQCPGPRCAIRRWDFRLQSVIMRPRMPREPKLRSLPHPPPSRTIGLRRMTYTPCVLRKGCDTIPKGTGTRVAKAVQGVTMGGDLGENHTIRSKIARVQAAETGVVLCLGKTLHVVGTWPVYSDYWGHYLLPHGWISNKMNGGVHPITQLRIPTSTVVRRSTETPRR